MLTQQRLKDVLTYDQTTGRFTWLVAPNGRIHVGQIAGNLNPYGYIQIKIDRVLYRAHRLAWLYMTGRWPSQHIDHRNRVRHDNVWLNLRDTSRTFNNQNLGEAKSGNQSTGLLGVSQRNKGAGFQARITADGEKKWLGTFPTAELAHAAYVQAKRALHPGNML